MAYGGVVSLAPPMIRDGAGEAGASKHMQIFEGTNQIQRLVISRHLSREA
ncbi:hypothetical protein [Spirillospora albida]|nr:hypothetical protein [Spirillospora albida]